MPMWAKGTIVSQNDVSLYFSRAKNKHLDTVKPRIDCGFGEGNIVAHVALPKAEAYQCFYT